MSKVQRVVTFFGRGIPDERFPKKCLVCRKPIRVREVWQAADNGEYKIIRHRSCIASRFVVK